MMKAIKEWWFWFQARQIKQFSMKYHFRKDKTVYYQVKVLMLNWITRSMYINVFQSGNFQVIQTLTGFCLTCVTLNLIVHIKTMWFITMWFIASLHLNRCLKVVSATLLLVCFLSLKESTCETWENVFYFTSKALSFCSRENQILVFQIFKFQDIIQCLSIKQETHFVE